MMSALGVTLRLEGKVLNEQQTLLAVPFLNLYHEDRITFSKFVAKTLHACEKANCPIHPRNESADL